MKDEIYYVRIIPETGVQTYNHGGKKIQLGDGWVEVPSELARELRFVPANASTCSTPQPLFDIVTRDQAEAITAYEEEAKQRGTLAFPSYPQPTAVPLTRAHPALSGGVPIRTPETRSQAVARASEMRGHQLEQMAAQKVARTDEEDWDRLEDEINEEEPRGSQTPPPPPPPPRRTPSRRRSKS